MRSATRAVRAAAAVIVVAAGTHLALRADQKPPREEGTRQLWDDDFAKGRPEAPQTKPTTRHPRVARPASPAPPASYVGVTLWRLSPAPATADSRSATVSGGGQRWAAQSEQIDREMDEGQQVRLSVEVSRPGYLYVVDREVYADGSQGDPVLIFPTRRIRSGDNALQPGRVIEVPDLKDDPPFFTLKRSRPDHVQEKLLLVVSPEPLSEVVPGDAVTLPAELIARWEAEWAVPHRKLEAQGGAGRSYSASERDAGSDPKRLLQRGEPLPQTLYRIDSSLSSPVLVDVRLRIKARS